jgi:hypothetical protein
VKDDERSVAELVARARTDAAMDEDEAMKLAVRETHAVRRQRQADLERDRRRPTDK